MRSPVLRPSSHSRALLAPLTLLATVLLLLFVLPARALGAYAPGPGTGALTQLSGTGGCIVEQSKPIKGCGHARALQGPGPALGSRAIAVSPDGKNVYVAASGSDAIAIFIRSASTGKLTQPGGSAGCISAGGAGGCAGARALAAPNSLAVSPDGRSVYATSLTSSAVVSFARNPANGALTQLGGVSGCITNSAVSGCTAGRALDGPDVVTVSPDGKSVYVGAYRGNALAVFARNTTTGALSQLSGTSGCVASADIDGCAGALALDEPEGLAVSPDGANVYAGTALSDSLDVFSRNTSTGAITQAAAPSGCITNSAVSGCTTGTELEGADAVAVSPNGANVYVTSLLSNALTSFTRTAGTGLLAQQSGTSACAIYAVAVGCSLARALQGPEGLVVSPDGANVYGAAFNSGSIITMERNLETGALIQTRGSAGCLTTSPTATCAQGRALAGVSSLASSPDGRYLYATAFKSNAVDVFKRAVAAVPPTAK